MCSKSLNPRDPSPWSDLKVWYHMITSDHHMTLPPHTVPYKSLLCSLVAWKQLPLVPNGHLLNLTQCTPEMEYSFIKLSSTHLDHTQGITSTSSTAALMIMWSERELTFHQVHPYHCLPLTVVECDMPPLELWTLERVAPTTFQFPTPPPHETTGYKAVR